MDVEPDPVATPTAGPPVPSDRPEVARLLAEVDRLESVQLEANAKHMRVSADHEAKCSEHDRCVGAVPSPLQLQPGDYAARVRACDARQPPECVTLEHELDVARSDNLAAMAEVNAARDRLARVERGPGVRRP